jgi:hypothetical protein
MVLAGTALSVLSVSSLGSRVQQVQAQQASPTPSTPPVAGNIVMVAPTDTIAAIQTKLNSLPAGGTLAFPANSAFNFNGRTVKGKDNVTIWANGAVTINGAPGPGSGGAFDFGGRASWTIRGKAPGQGFIFNATLVNAEGATGTAAKPWAVGNCVFNNSASNDLNGAAIRMTDASFGLVINNDLNNCQGNVLGQYNWDNITIDGNHFTNPYQIVSIDQGTDRSRGRSIIYRRNISTGHQRTGFETGGDASDGGPGQYFFNLLIDNNWFVDPQAPIPDGAGCLSIVARGQVNTKVTNNYFRKGLRYGKAYAEAIEISSKVGPVEVSGNLIDGFDAPFAYYDLGANTHDNKLWNCGGTPPPGNTVLTSAPAALTPPARIAW